MLEVTATRVLRPARDPRSWRVALQDAAIILTGCAIVGSVTNAVRHDGIDFIQKEDYTILVPCPETAGQADPIAPGKAFESGNRVLWIDARTNDDYHEWHPEGTVHMAYDYLEPAEPTSIRLIAASSAKEVIVYGDGQDPDSGEQLARELAGKGIRNVRYVAGGAPALQRVRQERGQP